jgi:hypothetical protein
MELKMNKKINKLKHAYGVEWFFYTLIFIYLMSFTAGYIFYYRAEKQASTIAKAVNSALCYDSKYTHKYSQIGQFELTKEDMDVKIKELLMYTSDLNNQYGADVLPYFIKESTYYSLGPDSTAKLLINIEDIENNGTIVPAGNGIILNDNNFYYLNSGNELEKIDNFDLEGNYKKFCDIVNDYNSDLEKDNAFNSTLLQPNNKDVTELRKAYYIPELIIKPRENIKPKDYFNETNLIDDLFEIDYKIASNTKRYVIDEEKTKELVELLIDDYNKEKKLKRHKYYTRFSDEEEYSSIYMNEDSIDYKKTFVNHHHSSSTAMERQIRRTTAIV